MLDWPLQRRTSPKSVLFSTSVLSPGAAMDTVALVVRALIDNSVDHEPVLLLAVVFTSARSAFVAVSRTSTVTTADAGAQPHSCAPSRCSTMLLDRNDGTRSPGEEAAAVARSHIAHLQACPRQFEK